MMTASYDGDSKGLELSYKSLEECQEGRERVDKHLSEDMKAYPKFAYTISECEKK